MLSAFQIVDGLRFIDGPVSVRDVRRLVAAVQRYHKPALKDLAEFLHPAQCLLWDGFDIASKTPHPPAQYVALSMF
jgi:nucleolar pre-ribosomal-associated protein 1